MPLFSYKAKNKKGVTVQDVIQASSRKEAATMINADDLKVMTIKNLDSKLSTSIGGGISVSDKASFCRFMSTMLRAGLTLPEAVDNIRSETKNDKLKKILYDVSFQTRKGASLSSVFSKYKDDFDGFFLTMIKAGETSGTIQESFDYLSKQLLAAYELTQKVKGAMMYPIVIVVAMLANAIIMITFVLPKLSDVFTQLNVDLPLPTRLLLNFGTFVGENKLLMITAMLGSIVFVILLFKIKTSRDLIFNMFIKFPAVNRLMVNIDVARFGRTLATMLRSGVPITQALEVSAGTLKNPRFIKKAKQFSEGVKQGEQLSDILLAGDNVFPSAMVQTIKAGETSGSLEDVLDELADFYEREVDYSLKRVTALLEPLLMLVIGIAVGGMVIMMIAPIYSLVGGFDQSL